MALGILVGFGLLLCFVLSFQCTHIGPFAAVLCLQAQLISLSFLCCLDQILADLLVFAVSAMPCRSDPLQRVSNFPFYNFCLISP